MFSLFGKKKTLPMLRCKCLGCGYTCLEMPDGNGRPSFPDAQCPKCGSRNKTYSIAHDAGTCTIKTR